MVDIHPVTKRSLGPFGNIVGNRLVLNAGCTQLAADVEGTIRSARINADGCRHLSDQIKGNLADTIGDDGELLITII